MENRSLAIGSDHAGFELKKIIVEHLRSQGIEVTDLGTNDIASTDYPDHAHRVAELVSNGASDLGILVCGSGNGVNMVANKHSGVRGALAWNEEVAALARQHNNANVLSLPARFITAEEAIRIVQGFMNAKFEGGRHERRVNKIETSC